MTLKRLKFVESYLLLKHVEKAAIEAGYSKKTARKIGENLLYSVPEVKEYLEYLKEKARKKVLAKYEITEGRILKERAKIAFFDMKSLLDDDGNLLPVSQWPEDAGAVINGLKIAEKAMGSKEDSFIITTTDLKLSSKDSSLQALEKIQGMYEQDNKQKKTETSVTAVLSPELMAMIDVS